MTFKIIRVPLVTCISALLGQTLFAQSPPRKPDAPPFNPPEVPRNVVDEEFRKAYRALGYSRLAVFVHVHMADVAVERRGEMKTRPDAAGDSENRTGRSGIELRVVQKEDQTNAWGIARGLGARLQSCFQHRDVRPTLISLDDLGGEQATELRALALRNEAEAAIKIGQFKHVDLVLMLTLSRAVESDAGGSRYRASYFLADVRRNDSIGQWSWDMKPDKDHAYPTPLLDYYARPASVRVREDLLRYAKQAAAGGGGTLRYHTLIFVGLPGESVQKLSDAIASDAAIHVRRSELETKNGTPTAIFEIESSLETTKLAEQVRHKAAETLSVEVSLQGIHEGNVEFAVSKR